MDGDTLARLVLAELIDKYEDSEAFRKGEPSQRRIQARMTDALVPGYTSGSLDPDVRHDLHTALVQAAERGLIELKWVKFEEGNILDKVYLVWDGLDESYAYLGRGSRRDELSSLVSELETWLHSVGAGGRLPDDWQWIGTWVNEAVEAAQDRGRIPTSLIPADIEVRQLVLRALSGFMDMAETSLPVRLFSKRVLGNSKVFEQKVQPHVVKLVRRYWQMSHPLDVDAPEDDSTLLRELGIESGHEDITFCGPVHFRYDSEDANHDADTDIDVGVFPHGLAIDASDVHRIRMTEVTALRILTIENKANYRTYVRSERRPDELVVYLGGFASPAQREFLRLLRAFASDAGLGIPEFHHWGDLDYGGILILQHLRNTCLPEVKPWRMETGLLDTHADQVEPIHASYRAKLERLLESDDYAWAHPLVERILEVGGTLEQEALLI